jgi:general secretion pathway protein M
MLGPRLRAVAAELPQLRAQLAELRRTANTRDVTLDGASDALASAGLQSRIERLAAASGVAIGSVEGAPPEARGSYRRIGLRISVSGIYEGIIKLLAAIETASPPLVLDDLQIHGRPMFAASLAPAQLDAVFAVYGLRRGETPAATKP